MNVDPIIRAFLEGLSPEKLARKFDLDLREVIGIIDRYCASSLRPEERARRLVREIERLDQLQTAFEGIAHSTQDPACADAVVALSKRKSSLLDIDQVRRVDLSIIEPEPLRTGHAKVMRVIEELCSLPAPDAPEDASDRHADGEDQQYH